MNYRNINLRAGRPPTVPREPIFFPPFPPLPPVQILLLLAAEYDAEWEEDLTGGNGGNGERKTSELSVPGADLIMNQTFKNP